MDKDPAFNILFNKSMADLSTTIALSKILEVGFVGLTSLVDVGGGTGSASTWSFPSTLPLKALILTCLM